VEYPNFYWECKPVSRELEKDLIFEFVVGPLDPDEVVADPTPFKEPIQEVLQSHVGRVVPEAVPVPDTGKRAEGLTLVPLPPRREDRATQNAASIGTFVRTGNPTVVDAFLTGVFAQLKRKVAESKRPETAWWLSTTGTLGTDQGQWLGLRIDTKPEDFNSKLMSKPPVAPAASSTPTSPRSAGSRNGAPTPIRSTFVPEGSSRFSRMPQGGVIYKDPAEPILKVPKKTSRLLVVPGVKSLNFSPLDASLEPHPFTPHHGAAPSSAATPKGKGKGRG
jgi:hypothetical protein